MIEYRNGLPYAVTDAFQNLVGVSYATKFPNFLSVDARVSKDFKITPKYTFRLSVSSYNLTDHFNPGAVHYNIADPAYGRFFGQRGRRFTADFDVLIKSAAGRTCLLLGISWIAFCLQGYHLGADDAAIYVPGIKQIVDPALYPFGAQFFHSHASVTLFPNLVGHFAQLTRLPINWVLLVWHFAGVVLLLFASWLIMAACFEGQAARWSHVALLAVLLSTPVAGTALAITDPYVTSRTLSTPAALFSVACFLSGQKKQGTAWLIFTACMHPQMSAYVMIFVVTMVLATPRAFHG